MRARSRRATIREVLDTALELERKTMQLYTALVAAFKRDDELRGFWFAMARHEAGHCGALALVESLVENDPSLAGDRKVWFDDTTVARLRALLSAYIKEARRGVTIERALAMALDIEGSELEDVVVELLQVVKDRRWRDQAVQMLIHDLGDLSFMIEKHTHDEVLLARADDLVERRVGHLRTESRRDPTPPVRRSERTRRPISRTTAPRSLRRAKPR
jgi:hypothetical protein